MRNAELRVVIAGGGTGGHLYPGIAIADALEAAGSNPAVLYVGARGGMEEKILAALGYEAVFLSVYGLRGSSALAWLKAPFVLGAAVARSARLLRAFRPDVVIGTGGYASVAVVIAATMLRVPRVLQEQNSVPGLVNRRLARFADAVLLAYEESRRWMSGARRAIVIGNPLRELPRQDRAQAARRLELDPALKTVLVIGGSRGARSINQAAAQAARALAGRADTQFLVVTGSLDYERARNEIGAVGGSVRVVAYLDEVSAAYSLADVAVARAGASSVFELAAFGVPTIFVPYPYAADDHQRLNVAALEERGGALVISDRELSGERLATEVDRLLSDAGHRQAMSSVMTDWAPKDAAARAAEEVLAVAKKKARSRNNKVWHNTLERTI